MDNSTRRTRFEARVGIERDFLTPVNVIFGTHAPLAGMTREAIASWEERAKAIRDDLDVTVIARILLEASGRAELLADNSKDVFEPDYRPRVDSLEKLRLLLNAALAKGASR